MALAVHHTPWGHPHGVSLRAAQEAEIAVRYGRPDSEPGPAPTAEDVEVFLVAYVSTDPVGCGGLRRLGPVTAEIKRMFVVPEYRGTGAATTLLAALEMQASDRGIRTLRLETGDRQWEAMRFYAREGYRPIPAYGYYVDSALSRCYEKDLPVPAPPDSPGPVPATVQRPTPGGRPR